MDKYEQRRLRLEELIKTRCDGVSAVFARRIERDASYVARMLYPEGKAGKKRIADDMMEVIEKAFALPRGYLDAPDDASLKSAPGAMQPHSPAQPYSVTDEALIEGRAKTLAQRASDIAKMWLELPAEARDQLEAEMREKLTGRPTGLKNLQLRTPTLKLNTGNN